MTDPRRDLQGIEGRPALRRKRLVAAVVVLTAAVLTVVLVVRLSGPHYFSRHVQVEGIAFPDASHAWVAGNVYNGGGLSITGGAILATTNGGTIWKQQNSATTWTPWTVAFANARCGWMLGSPQPVNNAIPADSNVVLATTDGGASWVRQDIGTSGTDFNLTDVACADATHVWAMGGGAVFATTNGGATWYRRYLDRGDSPNAAAFASAMDGWALGDHVVLTTTDGGDIWSRRGSVAAYTLGDIACADARHAWALGGDDKSEGYDVILATTDGGTTWKVQYSNARVSLTDMAFADTTHGWAVGFGGLILATTNGGATWQPEPSGTKMNLMDVAFADAALGLAAGERTEGDDPMSAQFVGSIILRTTDGGVTWRKQA